MHAINCYIRLVLQFLFSFAECVFKSSSGLQKRQGRPEQIQEDMDHISQIKTKLLHARRIPFLLQSLT